MTKRKTKVQTKKGYSNLVGDLGGILESARKSSVRSINSILTAAYWLMGKRIVDYEYRGMDRSEYYGEGLFEKLSLDLQEKYGKGFSRQNIQLMKQFYENYPPEKIRQTLSSKSLKNTLQTSSAQSFLNEISNSFVLPWSHYVMLLTVIDF